MPTPLTQQQILEAEARILRALCAGALLGPVRAEAMRILADYRWLGREHRVVFEALAQLKTDDPETIRTNLVASATRKGFPDVDVEIYVAPSTLPSKDWLALIQSLMGNAASTAE